LWSQIASSDRRNNINVAESSHRPMIEGIVKLNYWAMPPTARVAAAAPVRYFAVGLAECRSIERRPIAATDLMPDLPRRRLAPLGQLQEAFSRHNARLNANSSNICCSRSIKASSLRESDWVQTGIKNTPTATGVLNFRTTKVSVHLFGNEPSSSGTSIRIAPLYARFI
jgi:hypothetical protein